MVSLRGKLLRPRLTATGCDGVQCGFVTGTSGVASGNAAAGSSRPRALGVTRAPPRGRPASSSAAARPASEFGVSNAAARGCCRFRPGHGSLSPGAGSVDTPSPAAASITQDVPPVPPRTPSGRGGVCASGVFSTCHRVTSAPGSLAPSHSDEAPWVGTTLSFCIFTNVQPGGVLFRWGECVE